MKKFLILGALLIASNLSTSVVAHEVKPRENQVAVNESNVDGYLRGYATVATPSGPKWVDFYSLTADGDTLFGAGIDSGFWICEGTITVVNGVTYVDAFIDSSSAGTFYYSGAITTY